LEAAGYKVTTNDLLSVLVGVAANQGTLESVCSDLVGTGDAETIRRYLNEQLCVEELPALEAALNQALVSDLPPSVWRIGRDLAIDLHDRAYYGKTSQAEGLWVRGKAKDGTTRFYRIATTYVIVRGLRLTLGIHFVLPDDDLVQVLATLLQRVRTLALRVRRLLLDCGFAGIAVQEYLDHQRIPALIACPIRGKQGGTRALCQGQRSYRTPYTFKGAEGKVRTAEVAVCRVFTTHKRTRRLQRRAEWWLFILIHLDLTPRQVRRLYRRRFGIETSYRCAASLRGWTTSANPVYRFLLLGLSFFLLNVWLLFRWLFTQLPHKGQRQLEVTRFQLTRFRNFIRRALEQRYGVIHQIAALCPPIQ
jgi:putative transposase